jgi:anti-anti-sigma factor
MKIEVAVVENIARVTLCGRLDGEGVEQVETQFTNSVVPNYRDVVVDLSGVTFISSGGLKMFIVAAKALRQHDSNPCFVCRPAAGERDLRYRITFFNRSGRARRSRSFGLGQGSVTPA